jgi:hypothetical protein
VSIPAHAVPLVRNREKLIVAARAASGIEQLTDELAPTVQQRDDNAVVAAD